MERDELGRAVNNIEPKVTEKEASFFEKATRNQSRIAYGMTIKLEE